MLWFLLGIMFIFINQSVKPCDTVQKYVELDDKYRKYAAELFKLPEDSSWKKIRPVVARHYKLSNSATWEEIRDKRIVLGELDKNEDEAERKEWAKGLCLSESTSWPEIRKQVEKYKK